MKGIVALSAIAILTGAVDGRQLEFEVASVKLTATPSAGAMQTATRYYQSSAQVRSVIEYAYDLSRARIVDGPAWIASELWSIDARSRVPANVDEMRVMVRNLLADRFKLVIHRESRELSMFELRLARSDGALGPDLKKSAGECKPPYCGLAPGVLGPRFARVRGGGAPISALATYIERQVGRVVEDRTGLSGEWDFDLSYEAETRGPLPPSLGALARLPDAPPLSTALTEQLGLKLEATRGLVEVLVIDAIERPTPN